MKALAEFFGMLRPHMFALANRMIMGRAHQIGLAMLASGYQRSIQQRAFESEAWRLAALHMRDSKLGGKAYDREKRKAFNRALRRIEKRGSISEPKKESVA